MKIAEHSIRHEEGEEGLTKRKRPMDIWNMESGMARVKHLDSNGGEGS